MTVIESWWLLFSVNETHYHSMSLENLNYDLCESCYQSVSDEEKKLYSDCTVDPMAQYVKVIISAVVVIENLMC